MLQTGSFFEKSFFTFSVCRLCALKFLTPAAIFRVAFVSSQQVSEWAVVLPWKAWTGLVPFSQGQRFWNAISFFYVLAHLSPAPFIEEPLSCAQVKIEAAPFRNRKILLAFFFDGAEGKYLYLWWVGTLMHNAEINRRKCWIFCSFLCHPSDVGVSVPYPAEIKQKRGDHVGR